MTADNLLTEIDLKKAITQAIEAPFATKNAVAISVLRTDQIHPIISGNKWYKLKYHLQQVAEKGYKGIITFGGAYSNHLVATAYAGKLAGIPTVAVIRGEAPAVLSHTLNDIADYGMKLHFVSRDDYSNKDVVEISLKEQYPGFFWVPEGGHSALGVKGASEMLASINVSAYTHIACAVGTGTMMAGLMKAALPRQRVCGIPVLKLSPDEPNELESFIRSEAVNDNFELHYGFHEGGYAKKTPELIDFMNQLFKTTEIPSDFVYTGKLFKALFTLIEKGHFPAGSHILAIHSGGLQGNLSLKPGTLEFP